MRKFKAYMVTPQQITCKRWKGLSTPKKVMDFAKKNCIPCGWFTNPYTKKREPIVDWTTFQKAWKYFKRTGDYWYGFDGKKIQTRGPKFAKTRAQKPVYRKRTRKVVRMWARSKQYRRKAA